LKTKLHILFFLIYSFAFSQELPPIVEYAPNYYGAGNQNWMISQDKNNFMFFANNEGLLEYNGSTWKLYPSPNETIIRSVKVIGSKIYTGSYMEFGYWTRKSDGQLSYISLSQTIKNKILDDEQFWNILNFDQYVIFQSLNRIYIYDTKAVNFKIISPKTGINKSFRTNNSICFQTTNGALFEIESGKGRLVSDHPILKNNRIINIFSSNDGLLIQTQLNGFYKLIDNKLSKFSTEVDAELSASSVYSTELLSNGNFAIGTVSNGIFIIDDTGKLKHHMSQDHGLRDNTALCLFEDVDKNLWVGLDNGINCINLQSKIYNFVDNTGILGTVYSSKLFKGKLYIGTNQGLFYKKYKSSDAFKLIPSTKGQVWSLFEYDGTLFCGHDSGTFIVTDGGAKNIFPFSGTWNFKLVPNKKGLLLQGNYYGISVLEKINNEWIFRNKISGFDYSSKYLEIVDGGEIYVSHEYKGVFRLRLDNELSKVTTFDSYEAPQKGKNASLIKFKNEIYYAYKEGVFKLNYKTKQFEIDKLLSSVYEKDGYTSGKLIVDNSNGIWLFSKNYIHYFTWSKISDSLKENGMSIPSSLTNSMMGYENIAQLSNGDYLIGSTDGYYIMNINNISLKNYTVSIANITTNKRNDTFVSHSIKKNGDFKYDDNNISISYTVPEYNKYINVEYQYLLEGFQDEWSEGSSRSTVSFKNLPPGDYTFKVRAKFANSTLDNTAVYSFTILNPWYKTSIAIFVYFIFILVMLYHINKAYKNYYHKQNEKLINENNRLLEIKELENEQQMMRIRNEQLAQDVDSKSRELAVSTMSLNSKNELLAFIKEDLKKTNENESRSIKSVISTINKNISKDDTWNVFKQAFDSADKDFLKKLKVAHPSLTPNDLRLCAYLRLNLSSKEVAPLLNISVRSVEIKRYRLRKKMDLSHEQGLVEYILAV
jgi:DNA-binding CsgD family transcriptional regulator